MKYRVFVLLGLIGVFVMPNVVVAGSIRATSDVCGALKRSNSVAGADYVPGVDVHGKPVVSADVGDDNQQMRMEVVSIPIDVDLAERYELDLPDGVEMKPTLGRLDIYRDGRVMFDGKDVSDQIEGACGVGRESATKSVEVPKSVKTDVPKIDPKPVVIEEKDPDIIEGQAY